MSKIENKVANAIISQQLCSATAFKRCSAIVLILIAVYSTSPLFAQKNDGTTSPGSATEKTYKQMVNYSRPGKYHQLFGDLVGKWTFKVINYDLVSGKPVENQKFTGTVVREPFANGRYFIVNVLADEPMAMDVPSKVGGKVVEKFRVMDVEGYDNVKKKFVTSSITNNLFSSIRIAEGDYDPATKTITLYSQIEAAPGMKNKEKELYIFNDNSHYKMAFYEMVDGKYRKETEVAFTRSN